MTHPEPEVRARPATPEEIPGGCRQVLRILESKDSLDRIGHSWQADFARGTSLRGRIEESVVLRVRSQEARWSAHWIEGKFDCAYRVWPTLKRLSSRELKEEVRNGVGAIN